MTEPDLPSPGSSQAAIARARALAVLAGAALGDRLVVRAHDGTGARDALGELTGRTADTVTIATRRGPLTVLRSDVVAAKPVPPPPPSRTAPHAPTAPHARTSRRLPGTGDPTA
ncbi:ferrous iron transport protein A [Curtobacterium sp. MCBD17_032]|uniref:ferrous iron transport protein A n=1 Tax=Curtobacterium sp. MCBD17_032 TaxID=2175659 RepID=UPI0015E8BEE1|nr:ferrous iron transport protein A [Curtobacterium sp. MCBD17_032]